MKIQIFYVYKTPTMQFHYQCTADRNLSVFVTMPFTEEHRYFFNAISISEKQAIKILDDLRAKKLLPKIDTYPILDENFVNSLVWKQIGSSSTPI
ncbi:MAG: hypothetical protein EAY65_04715 [Alphaproteobacteria bacterium]|nr:MAG: hypothetical protein EAY65_04715 [Alphaproteobacteria bacterium]